jgi:hypothetical protein
MEQFHAFFRRRRQAKAKRIFSHIRRLSGRVPSARFDLHRQLRRREWWRESNPRFQPRGLSNFPGMIETATKFPLREYRAPYPTPCLVELKHRIRASTALRCLSAPSHTARAYCQFGKAMRYSYIAANSSLSIFPIGCHGISLPSW